MRWTEKTVHVEKKEAHGNLRVHVILYAWCVPYMVCLTAHGLLRSSVDINILSYLYNCFVQSSVILKTQ